MPELGRRWLGVIGDPVRESLSPAMHRAAFAATGLSDLHYIALTVPQRDLERVFPYLRRSFLGVNVTIPLKQAVLELVDDVAEAAARAGSANTLTFTDDHARADSTDGAGFLRALERAGATAPHAAVILGTGGAARAVAAALARHGTRVTLSGRNASAGAELAADIGGCEYVTPAALAPAISGAALLVNATPVGSTAQPDASPLGAALLRADLTVFDLVYRPRRTALLRDAERAGCRTIEGVEMLIEQGAASFEIWTGVAAPVDVMRAAAHGALARSAA